MKVNNCTNFQEEDKTDISNYRPISLTNTDYRLLAFALSARVQKVIANIISPDQVAYIKGRFIGTNTRLIQDIFNLYNTKDKSGLLMFVDFKKAFDYVEWSFLFKVLEKFNFGPNFQHWIKLLYTNPCAYVKNNGFFSEEFSIQRCKTRVSCFLLTIHTLYGGNVQSYKASH